jgi:hypothetical protein
MNLKDFATKQLADSKAASDKRDEEFHRQYRKMLANQVKMKKHLRAATEQEYVEWLQVRYEKFKDANISAINGFDDIWIATSNLTVYPLLGALSMNIIVPEGVTVWYSDEIGHNKLYFHDGSTIPSDCVVYVSDNLLKYL